MSNTDIEIPVLTLEPDLLERPQVSCWDIMEYLRSSSLAMLGQPTLPEPISSTREQWKFSGMPVWSRNCKVLRVPLISWSTAPGFILSKERSMDESTHGAIAPTGKATTRRLRHV
ncbi:unnamed protein product [Zymoseptoria tritici ST99CH_1A5]|nr:unnamed protein product [Zymoseptoria tritici ST99CH_1A5]